MQQIKFVRKIEFKDLEAEVNTLSEQGFLIQQYLRIPNTVFPFEAVMIKDVKETKKIKEKEKDIIDNIIELFSLKYKESRGYDYLIPNKARERSASGKLLLEHKKKFPEFTSEDTLKSLEGYFKAIMTITDNFIFTNMGLPIVIHKFNAINTILRNGRTNAGLNKQVPATTEEQFLKAIAEGLTTK